MYISAAQPWSAVFAIRRINLQNFGDRKSQTGIKIHVRSFLGEIAYWSASDSSYDALANR